MDMEIYENIIIYHIEFDNLLFKEKSIIIIIYLLDSNSNLYFSSFPTPNSHPGFNTSRENNLEYFHPRGGISKFIIYISDFLSPENHG